tara:strand:- start:120 stop:821 length:702 start_codon:yes stop_codon:yes gene_type:complete
MDNLLPLLTNTDYNFTSKINSNDYIEKIRENKINKYSNFIFCLLDNYDLILSNTLVKDKNIIFHKRISDILSQIDDENLCEKYKYNSKKFKSNLIQKNILSCSKDKNILLLSCIYFFNDYYKTHFKIVNKKNSTIINTCIKDYPIVYIYFDNNFYLDKNNNNNNESFSILSDDSFFTIDIPFKNVYKLYLESISKYKIDELKTIAKNNNIPLSIKMKKQDIYDKINIHMLNLI